MGMKVGLDSGSVQGSAFAVVKVFTGAMPVRW